VGFNAVTAKGVGGDGIMQTLAAICERHGSPLFLTRVVDCLGEEKTSG
jgi:hypothetical protein